MNFLIFSDPSPAEPKKKKHWDPFDRDDPNCEINLRRARLGEPPIDLWNIGVQYTYKGIFYPLSLD